MHDGPDPLAPRATIADVARAAGVSTGTVSRVLNDRPGVHPDTRAAVLDAVVRLDYRPDRAARQLSFGQQRRIGINIGLGSRRLTPYFTLLFEYLVEAFGADGYRIEEVATRPDGLPARLPDGMVLLTVQDDDPRLPYLREQGVPFVVVGRAEGVSWVAPDDRQGGIVATRHLLKLGHERILYVSGSTHAQVFYDRLRGHADALADAGIGFDRERTLLCDPTPLGAYRALRRRLEAGDVEEDGEIDVDAVFGASDEIATGVVAALRDAGLRVPDDVSVIGFDDLPELDAPLTTIRQDIARIAATAVTLLDEALDGRPERQVVVPVRLVTRGTTARRR